MTPTGMGTEIPSLVERLRAASGPDRSIDADLWLRFEVDTWDKDMAGIDWWPEVVAKIVARLRGGGDDPDVPRYTASLDAALTLKPEGANCHGYDLSPVGIDAYWSRNYVQGDHWLFEGFHETSAPIALCIAAIKARQAQPAAHQSSPDTTVKE